MLENLKQFAITKEQQTTVFGGTAGDGGGSGDSGDGEEGSWTDDLAKSDCGLSQGYYLCFD